VYFTWQILDWTMPATVQDRMGLMFEGVASATEQKVPEIIAWAPHLVHVPMPSRSASRTGVHTTAYVGRPGRDYAVQDAKNRSLGLAGEMAVLAAEKRSLIAAGRQDLADRIVHVAKVEGDGAGYDLRSFTPDGHEKFVEVKTTRGNEKTAFYASASEVRFSIDHTERYYLYRVFDFDERTGTGKVFVQKGALGTSFALSAVQFKAELTGTADGDVRAARDCASFTTSA
jgi:hypothetical protein